MKMNKLSMVLGAAAFLGFSSAALAADAVKLNCPAGSVQKMGSVGEKISCLDKAGKVVPGPVAFLHPNGKLAALGQSDGRVKTGLWTVYTADGVKDFTVTYKESRYHGTKTEFHANGAVKRVTKFQDGAQVGAVQEFDLTGKAITTTAAK